MGPGGSLGRPLTCLNFSSKMSSLLLDAAVPTSKKSSPTNLPFPINSQVFQTRIGDQVSVDLLVIAFSDRIQVNNN